MNRTQAPLSKTRFARNQFLRFGVMALCCLALAVLVESQARADMEAQLRLFGGEVAKALKSDGHSAVRFKIEGSAAMPSSGPAMVREVMSRELIANNIKIEKFRAPVAILGKLKVIELPKGGGNVKVQKIILQLKLSFVDRNDAPILDLDKNLNVTDLAEISQLLGLPFESHPGQRTPDGKVAEGDGRGFEGSGGVVDGFVNPQQNITSDTKIRASQNGAFAIEVIANGIARTATTEGGLAFVKLKEHDKCTIRLINDADYEVAVQLTLDGVDCFWFSPKRSGLWLVPPHKTLLVKGWQLDEGRARQFQVVPFEQSVAAKLGPSGDFGVIAASYRRAYPPNATVPVNDRSLNTKRIGIGAGDEFKNKIKYVSRKLGKVRATVPVRYEKPAR